jgi:exonuclease SbcD
VRLLHSADIHLGVTRFSAPGDPHSRLRDLSALLDRFRHAAALHDVDLAVISGDLFDTRHPRPREWAVATRFISDLAAHHDVVVVDGNHDGAWVISDHDTRTLSPLGSIEWGGKGEVHVPLRPMVHRMRSGVSIVSVPYPHKRLLDAAYPDMDPLERHEKAAVLVEDGIRALAEQAMAEARGPVIFVGHLTVAGSLVGSERTMRLEDDISVGPGVFEDFDYAALGHIHLQQRVGTRGWYAGSPAYIDFGERGQEKGFLLATIDPGRAPEVVSLPSGDRPLLDIAHEGEGYEPNVDVADAIVRLRIPGGNVTRLVRAYYAAGATYVQPVIAASPEQVVSERAIPTSLGPTEALQAFLRLRSLPDEPYLSAARRVMEE